MLYDEFNSYKNFAGADVFKNKALEKADILKNLNLAFLAREYQKEALGRFYYYCEEYPGNKTPIHLLFNMATGSGKTLIMAANILYLYQKGYRNFIFFTHLNNILEKTRDNFLNALSSKYLFADKIIFGGREVKIKEVENFDGVNGEDINIIFSTIHTLHNRMNTARENALTEEYFEGKEIVLIADEAHHYQAQTRTIGNRAQQSFLNLGESDVETPAGLSREEKEEFKAWETTIKKKILPKRNANNEMKNILLEYTATMDLENQGIKEKYEDKIIYKYDLASFREDKYSKEIEVLQAGMEPMDRALQAAVLSQYRRKIAEKFKLYLKPVILFKSKTIAESKENEEKFRKMADNLRADDLKRIALVSAPSVKKASVYFKENNITLADLAKEIKNDFSKEKCVAVNSKDDSMEKQLLVNSLEDKNNEIRAIFVVDMLNEGWDVLNLFDIVRLYDTRDAKNNRPGKTTMAEAQLIGRGARYWPFQLDGESDKSKRKYDRELENDLRILEQLHYHCSHNPDYLSEIKNALRRTGALENNRAEKEVNVKKEFEETYFWKKGKIFLNKRNPADKSKLKGLKDFNIKRFYQYALPTYKIDESEAMEDRFDLRQQDGTVGRYSLKVGEISGNIARTALSRNKFFYFDNLKKFLPNLSSINDFLGKQEYLASVEIEISGRKDELEKIKNHHPESFEYILKALISVLAIISEEIAIESKEWSGSAEFSPEEIKKRLRNKKISFDAASNRVEAVNLAMDISRKKWFAQTDFWGTPLEVSFLEFFGGFYDGLSEKYDDIALIRNELFWPIYNFSDGQAFYPDFVLFLRKKNGNKIDSMQIFVEPKGEIYAKAEPWKEQLLLAMENEGKIRVERENEKFKILGMPFYNKENNEMRNKFEEAFEKYLLN